MKIMRACTVPQSFSFVKGMLPDLCKKYEVVLLSSPGEQLCEVTKEYGVRGIGVPMERHISLLKDFIALFKLVRILRREKPVMIHSMTPKAGMLCMLAGWITRVPVRVHTFTGLVFPTSTGVKRRILMFTDWLTCACATYVIPEGEGVKNDLQNNGITKKPLRVLGYGNVKGVDMDYYSCRPEVMEKVTQIKNSHTDNRDKTVPFTFLFVGRIVGDKGINELCHAFVQIHQEHPQTRLWLVGAYEENLDPISSETKSLIESTESGIEAVGAKRGDELLAYYAAADCFVMPSYREGFPNTVLEAGAMGLPSIVTDINGSREIIKEGKNGMIVPPKNEEQLYGAMMVMFQSNIDRCMMASNARRMIATRFEQGYVRQCLYDFYDEILQGKDNVWEELQQVNTEL